MSTPDPDLPPYSELVSTVAALVKAVEHLTGRQQAEQPQSWLTIDDPDTAGALFGELVGWSHDVWARYPDSQLPDCWYRHPWAIEELHACRLAWTGALRRGAPAGLLAEWHRTVRPGTYQRIRQGLMKCDPDQHPLTQPTLPEPNDPDDVVIPWTNTRDEPSHPDL